QDRALLELAADKLVGSRLDDLDFRDHRIAHTLDLLQQRDWRGNHLGKRAEPGDQVLCERFHIATRQGAEQNELQKLVVGKRARPGLEETLAQPLAMAVEMGSGFEVALLALVVGHAARSAPGSGPRRLGRSRPLLRMNALPRIAIARPAHDTCQS